MFKCGQEICVINICPSPLAVVYLSHFSLGHCSLRQSPSVPEVSQRVKYGLWLQHGGSHLEMNDLEKALMPLETIVTTGIGLLGKGLMW